MSEAEKQGAENPQWVAEKVARRELREAWSKAMANPEKGKLSAGHHLLYAALRGRDWRTGFQRPLKVENGRFEGWALWTALGEVTNPFEQRRLLAPFRGTVSPERLREVRKRLPLLDYHEERERAEEYRNRSEDGPQSWPVAAYTSPVEAVADAGAPWAVLS